MKTVIGLVGPIASGKGTLCEFLKKKGFTYFSLSNVVREETTDRGLEMTRQNLQDVGNDLREKFGGSVLVDKIIDRVKKHDLVVIDGVRNPKEILAIKGKLGGNILHVSANKPKRQKRYLERAKIRGEDIATVSKFNKVDERDLGKGESGSGQQVAKCLEMADFKIENNSTIEKFYQRCDELLKNLSEMAQK